MNKPPIDGGCLLKNNGTENPRYGLTKLQYIYEYSKVNKPNIDHYA